MNENLELNEQQKVAVDTLKGPVLVLAGAGTGKTRVVTYRIAKLLEMGVPSSEILGLTFTNKAANEMKERVKKKTNSNVLISTFHSLGARILRESIDFLGYRRDFTIYDEEDSLKVLKECSGLVEKDLKEAREKISQYKNQLLSQSHFSSNTFNSSFLKIYENYQKKLQEYNAVDYDDLLFLVVRLFKEFPDVLAQYQNRWQYLLIDEYQDTNEVQYTIVNLLVQNHGNLCVVGDPDQSIYSWRGANINNILEFEFDYQGAKVVKLEQNYRSRSNILNAANALISKNEGKYEKQLWSHRGEGETIQYCHCGNDKIEAMFVAERVLKHHENGTALHEMAVFFRTNSQSRIFEDVFLQYRIPYVIVGGISFYQRKEIKDMLAWLRILQSGSDYISFQRTINLPKRGLGPTSLERIGASASEEQCDILTFCQKIAYDEPVKCPVKLTANQKAGLKQYVSIIAHLKDKLKSFSLSELIKETISTTEYGEYLKEDQVTYRDRIENLNSLVAKAADWQESSKTNDLRAFLEELSLKSNLDEIHEDQSVVNLMTMHNGKGLEFDVVFLTGMEEELFPHINSREEQDGLEEERRLCYVGMTRAKEHLYFSSAEERRVWGVFRKQRASRFIREIPGHFLKKLWIETKHQPAFIDRKDDFKSKTNPTLSKGDIVFHQEYGVGCINNSFYGTGGLTFSIFFTKENCEKQVLANSSTLKKI